MWVAASFHGVTLPFLIRRLAGADAARYRDLRLEALRAHPTAFGAD